MDARAGFEALRPLLGPWSGGGTGRYPTIASFEYLDRLQFTADPERALIHYEQFTQQRTAGESTYRPSHWESGFVRPVDGGQVEISNAQDGGRVEVLRGPIRTAAGVLVLELASILLGYDDRLVRTQRRIVVEANHLRYEVHMHTTRVPALTLHLEAELQRCATEFAAGRIVF